MIKVTLRLNRDDYEYIRAMAASKFDYGGLNLIIREVIHAFVVKTKALEQQHRQQQLVAPAPASEGVAK